MINNNHDFYMEYIFLSLNIIGIDSKSYVVFKDLDNNSKGTYLR